MSQAADSEQAARYYELLTRVENAITDPAALGAAESIIGAANLDERDRQQLLGLVATYRADQERIEDRWDAYGRGDGPEPEEDPLPSDEDAQADAEADRKDGFEPVEPGTL